MFCNYLKIDLNYLQGLNSALDRAVNYFKNNTEWEQLVHKVMEIEFNWDSSASQYEDLYSMSLASSRSL